MILICMLTDWLSFSSKINHPWIFFYFVALLCMVLWNKRYLYSRHRISTLSYQHCISLQKYQLLSCRYFDLASRLPAKLSKLLNIPTREIWSYIGWFLASFQFLIVLKEIKARVVQLKVSSSSHYITSLYHNRFAS